MEKLDSTIVWQIAIVVEDIEKTARNYSELFGVEMPEIIYGGPPEETKVLYRDNPVRAEHKMAFIKMGLMQLEIIEPNHQPSAWRDFLDNQGEGVHHIALNVGDVTETLEFLNTKGMKLLQRGEFGGGSYHYVDSYPALGVVLELSEKKKERRIQIRSEE